MPSEMMQKLMAFCSKLFKLSHSSKFVVFALSHFLCKPTFSFCSCQLDSRVVTVIGDGEWALDTIHIYLDIL